jgi:hypothetical protein
MPAALTSLEVARKPAPVLTDAVPADVRTAPVAVSGLATALRRKAWCADALRGTTVARAPLTAYRLIWDAGPRTLLRQLNLTAVVGHVLNTARTAVVKL